MKKIITSLIVATILSLASASFALEPMSKENLKKSTAQAGVSIFFDHIVLVIRSQPTVTYWDNDGNTFLTGLKGKDQASGIRIEYSSKKSTGQK